MPRLWARVCGTRGLARGRSSCLSVAWVRASCPAPQCPAQGLPAGSASAALCPRIEVDDRTEAYLRVLQQKVTSDTQIVSTSPTRRGRPAAPDLKGHLGTSELGLGSRTLS